MTRPESKNNSTKVERLEQQIEIRITLAREKLDGQHKNLNIPLSLRQNRVWEDKVYGVEKIGSPTSFTTTHKHHGKRVIDLNDLLIQLKEPAKKKYTPLGKTVDKLTLENERLNLCLVKMANQFVEWQTELDEMRDMLQIAQSSEQGLIESKRELQAELKEKEEFIKNLRLELIAARKSGITSTITKVDFGGDEP